MAATAAALTVMAPVGQQPARAAGSAGSISGTVTNASGSPLAGVCATAYPDNPSLIDPPTTGGTVGSPTNGAGQYSITGLAPGGYRVHFADCSGDDRFPMWYPQGASYRMGKAVTVTAGQDTSGVDVSLGPGGLLTGTVTDQNGTPLGGVCVTGGTQGETADRVRTDSNGDYQLPVRADAPYGLYFDPCDTGNYVAENSSGQVTAGRGQTTAGVNAVLAPGAVITGVITDSASGAPLPGACASAEVVMGGPGSATQQDVPADDTGRYVIDGLSAGTYAVSFAPCQAAGNHLSQWYPDASSPSGAQNLSIADGSTTDGINAALGEAGSISGTVTDTSGAPAVGACVSAYGQTTADSTGQYQLRNVPPGSYTVQFGGCGNSAWLAQTYLNQPPGGTPTPVTVTAGQDTAGIDDQLTLGAQISGTVTDTAGNPLYACVEAWSGGAMQYGGQSGGLGGYTLFGLTPGTYQVRFRDCNQPAIYATQWWDNQTGEMSAAQITLSPGQSVTGINAAMTSAYPVTVTGVSPQPGPPEGDSLVQIRGTGFTGATQVDFGTQAAQFEVDSDSEITAITPPGSPGTVDVTVTAPAGVSPLVSSDHFTYQTQPEVDSVSPPIGPSAGGTTVTLTGHDLNQVFAVAFGGIPARSFTRVDDSHLTAVVPTGDTGSVDIQFAAYPTTEPQQSFYSPTLAARYCYDSCPAPAATTVAVNAPTQTVEGQPAWLNASVSVQPGATPASGNVTFYADGSPIGSTPVTGPGQAAISWTPPEEGAHTITAAYGGDPYNAARSSAPAATSTTDAPLTVTVAALNGVEGTAVSPATPVSGAIAQFTDADPAGQAGDYTATIRWGDGVCSAGTVSPSPNGPGFQVTGSHTYAEDGTYPVTVTVTDSGGATSQQTGSARIADPADPVSTAVDVASDLTGP